MSRQRNAAQVPPQPAAAANHPSSHYHLGSDTLIQGSFPAFASRRPCHTLIAHTRLVPLPGIKNSCNDCFWISITQSLAQLVPLREFILRLSHGTGNTTPLLSALKQFFASDRDADFDCAKVFAALKNKAFKDNKQHDPTEYLLSLWEQLESEVGSAEKAALRSLFGTTQEFVRCSYLGCSAPPGRSETPFKNLELQGVWGAKMNKIEDLFEESVIKKEKVEDFRCTADPTNIHTGSCTKHSVIRTAPKILQLSVNRCLYVLFFFFCFFFADEFTATIRRA